MKTSMGTMGDDFLPRERMACRRFKSELDRVSHLPGLVGVTPDSLILS